MKSSRVQRWDLVVGVVASLVAISGLGLSIAVGNTASVGFGNVHRETQNLWCGKIKCAGAADVR